MDEVEREQADAATRMWQLLSGHMVSQAISAVAGLGIADRLAAGSVGADELAQGTGSHEPSLRRLLRALASFGVFAEDDDGRFGLTPLGELLRTDGPGSMHPAAVLFGGEHARAWLELAHAIRTGEAAFPHVFGEGVFDYAARHADMGRMLNRMMTESSARLAADIVGAYDFSRHELIVDVGGGQGQLLAAVLGANPEARGIVFDLPGVAGEAGPLLAERGVAGRCEALGGSFFDAVPAGGDLYVLKYIVHDWDDEQSLQILSNCRRAMAERGAVLVIERVMPDHILPDPDHQMTTLGDLNMLVVAGGRERTESEYRSLFEAADLRLDGVTRTGSIDLIEARAK